MHLHLHLTRQARSSYHLMSMKPQSYITMIPQCDPTRRWRGPNHLSQGKGEPLPNDKKKQKKVVVEVGYIFNFLYFSFMVKTLYVIWGNEFPSITLVSPEPKNNGGWAKYFIGVIEMVGSLWQNVTLLFKDWNSIHTWSCSYFMDWCWCICQNILH